MPLAKIRADFEAYLAAEMESWFAGSEGLGEAVLYTLRPGSKRVRPLLVLAGASLSSAPLPNAYAAAAAVEMVHTYSLIHDDLPAMDDDDWRRGRPSCHKKFGQADAILAGDALCSEASAFLRYKLQQNQASAPVIFRQLDLLQNAMGPRQMIFGQWLDMHSERLLPERTASELLEQIHQLKTGALLHASLLMGAELGEGHLPAAALSLLDQLGRQLGLYFQIIDDVLDETDSSEGLGKTAGKDAAQGKLTFPGLYGVAAAKERAQGMQNNLRQQLSEVKGMVSPAQSELLESVFSLLEGRLTSLREIGRA